MIQNLRFGDYIFAQKDKYPPCGMFTVPHIVAAALCFALVILAISAFRRRASESKSRLLCRIIAPVITVLELIKITHNLYYRNLNLDSWFPLSFCGLFIFAVWASGYGRAGIKAVGDVFIAYGCPVGGIAFLIFPTTSLMSYPIWHYFSLYSLFFHSAMLFFGVLFLINEEKLNKKRYLTYAVFILIFSSVSIAMNAIWGCNLMNLREPYNIPIALLQNMYAAFPPSYTVFVLFGYLMIPAVVGGISGKLRK